MIFFREILETEFIFVRSKDLNILLRDERGRERTKEGDGERQREKETKRKKGETKI